MKNIQKQFVFLLACIFSFCSVENLYANSSVGHTAVGIYCIWKMTQDPSFMPDIQGVDRQELTRRNILNCSDWDDLTDAQRAFLQGMNFPDCPSLMYISHNEAPIEVLAAMYSLKDICPSEYSDQSDAVKAFVCRMQRFMTWGAKLHIEMDKITHARLPYAKDRMEDHVFIENSWDAILSSEIFNRIAPQKSYNLSKLANSMSFNPLRSKNYEYNNQSLDIRDDYVDLIIRHYLDAQSTGFFGSIKDKIEHYRMVGSTYLDGTDALRGINRFENHEPLPARYQYPSNYADLMIDLAHNIKLTVPPTQSDINNQYNIDLPAEMQPGASRGPTQTGQKLLRDLAKP